MKKLWAIRIVWCDGSHLGKDNIKLFDTRKDARIAKKNMKSLVGTVKGASMHQVCEDEKGLFLSKKVYY